MIYLFFNNARYINHLSPEIFIMKLIHLRMIKEGIYFPSQIISKEFLTSIPLREVNVAGLTRRIINRRLMDALLKLSSTLKWNDCTVKSARVYIIHAYTYANECTSKHALKQTRNRVLSQDAPGDACLSALTSSTFCCSSFSWSCSFSIFFFSLSCCRAQSDIMREF